VIIISQHLNETLLDLPAVGLGLIAALLMKKGVKIAVRLILRARGAFGEDACIFEDELAELLAGPRSGVAEDEWKTRRNAAKDGLLARRSAGKWALQLSGKRVRPGGEKSEPCWFLPASDRTIH
jgi:hypothetical protein